MERSCKNIQKLNIKRLVPTALKTTTTNMATPKLSLKLLIDNKSKRVLYAEAGKDVVDFLFSLLSMPLGSVANLLKEKKMVGCIESLYESVQSLDESYILSKQNKINLLNPTSASLSSNPLLLTGPRSTAAAKQFYTCSINQYDYDSDGYEYNPPACIGYYTDIQHTVCPSCKQNMSVKLCYAGPNLVADPAGGSAGFVQTVVTYIVMDDLMIMPMSTISSITLLNKFNVRDVGLLEERLVNLGRKQASLQSKTVLTDVFLSKMLASKE